MKIQVGERFGKLLVIKVSSEIFTGNKRQGICECQCDCGMSVTVRSSALRHDGKDSCGCDDKRGNRSLCRPGEKYGKLTILRSWSEKIVPTKSKERICECKCDCGSIITVRGRYLRSEHKASCGCLRHLSNKDHHAWKGHGEISLSTWSDIKKSANRRSRTIPFSLTIEEAWALFVQQDRKCAISGVPIKFSTRNRRYENTEHTASLDRIDSAGAYTLENVQWVHKTIQCMKWALPQDDFIKWCKLVAANG